ncbi:bacteriocin fulvocin C-related protein [Amycolatopsis suaedae]|uniref:Bacteriocin fulvocin C-related protein n=1 Tax=Amycolatopsis suaedae TaxID=2510978 RepID=A0A4V2EL16_9PSEU|nr:bacteriocin fulvocin C-related protein [Amycolatopsis suaedae]RZQ59995.1 hypothetical protein EWH70_31720 [Amycolatopsis suaedae]
MSAAVAEASGGRLEILPLTDPDVRGWLGNDAPWEPTLLRVDGAAVRSWTRLGMALPLVRRLGVRATGAVLRALGQVRHEMTRRHEPAGIDRKQFLRLGAGVVVAGGLVLSGSTPAFAANPYAKAIEWTRRNRDALPATLDEFTRYSATYRRAIHAELAPAVRSRLWSEHVRRYRAAHAGLTAEQSAVLDRLRDFFGDPANLRFVDPAEAERIARIDALRTATESAFGESGARTLLVDLGGPTAQAPLGYCRCSTASDYCSATSGGHCVQTSGPLCTVTPPGCGFGGLFVCDGLCFP